MFIVYSVYSGAPKKVEPKVLAISDVPAVISTGQFDKRERQNSRSIITGRGR